jgi:hypothetical protein
MKRKALMLKSGFTMIKKARLLTGMLCLPTIKIWRGTVIHLFWTLALTVKIKFNSRSSSRRSRNPE